MLGALHTTKAWYALMVGYLAFVARVVPNPAAMLPRVAVAAATSAGMFISHGYHNPDQKSHALSPVPLHVELAWLRLDYVSISFILSANYLLWATNVGWIDGLRKVGAACFACTAAVAAASYALVSVLRVSRDLGWEHEKSSPSCSVGPGAPRRRRPRRASVARRPVPRLSAAGGLVVVSGARYPSCLAVYLCFLPGFVVYCARWPQSNVFGYHELFHASVLLGHVACVALDARFLLSRF